MIQPSVISRAVTKRGKKSDFNCFKLFGDQGQRPSDLPGMLSSIKVLSKVLYFT